MPPREPPTEIDERRARSRVADRLGLAPEVVAVSVAMFVMGLGEQLWRRFLPKYLESFGAPVTVIGLFGTTEDFLDGVYQYPGGWVADRYGRRRALLAFVTLAALGYALFALMPAWPVAVVALALVMAWDSMASPTLFAVVGDALPPAKRTMGFTVQSILRRVPIIVAPAVGGLAIARLGIRGGVRSGCSRRSRSPGSHSPWRRACASPSCAMNPPRTSGTCGVPSRDRSAGSWRLTPSFACAIAPAAFVGGLLWRESPELPFYVAGAIGLFGTLVFIRTVDAHQAG